MLLGARSRDATFTDAFSENHVRRGCILRFYGNLRVSLHERFLASVRSIQRERREGRIETGRKEKERRKARREEEWKNHQPSEPDRPLATGPNGTDDG